MVTDRDIGRHQGRSRYPEGSATGSHVTLIYWSPHLLGHFHSLTTDVDRFYCLKEGSRTRGHKAALVKEQCRLDMRKYSFSQRVINEWNKLPNDCSV